MVLIIIFKKHIIRKLENRPVGNISKDTKEWKSQ